MARRARQALIPRAVRPGVLAIVLALLGCSKAEPERITARPWNTATPTTRTAQGTATAGASGAAPLAAGIPPPAAASFSPLLPARQLRLVRAADGEVAALGRGEAERQKAIGRTTLVYVGAKWCEPCRNFHRAAAAGELDKALPDVTMIEFDLDDDKTRLEVAGYASTYIPLFALPSSDGKASGKQIEGAVKGAGSVGDLVPRLRALLGR